LNHSWRIWCCHGKKELAWSILEAEWSGIFLSEEKTNLEKLGMMEL